MSLQHQTATDRQEAAIKAIENGCVFGDVVHAALGLDPNKSLEQHANEAIARHRPGIDPEPRYEGSIGQRVDQALLKATQSGK